MKTPLIVVSNTSPIINLAAIGQLDILHRLFGAITIPDAVYEEIAVRGAGQPGSTEIQSGWIHRTAVRQPNQLSALLGQGLHAGEAEAITLAGELGAGMLLMDEKLGRAVAERLGLPYTGLLGVLLEAKRRQEIAAVQPLLDALRSVAGFRVHPSLYAYVLRQAGEMP